MKILFTGGGTGGHFYPLIAIAEQINKIAREEKILDMKLYFMADDPYDKQALFENDIFFISVMAGKQRVYKSAKNGIDAIKMGLGCIEALFKMFTLFPDIVVSKGGYASFPALFAARFFRIPVLIHESDTYPGRVNVWAGKFAIRIALSYGEAMSFFPQAKTAHTGQPIREEIMYPVKNGASEYLNLDPSIPVILVLGGSQGSEKINDSIIQILPELVKRYQIIHQVGSKNIENIESISSVVLEKSKNKDRYKPFPFLNKLALKMSAGIATIVITRAGSALFEIASWNVPAIVIPITKSNGNHQIKNAYSYARSGSGIVIEEANLTPHTFLAEINKMIDDQESLERMKQSSRDFARRDAAYVIARECIDIAISHEK